MPTSARKKRNRYKLGRERDTRATTSFRPRIPNNILSLAEVQQEIRNESEGNTSDEDSHYPYKAGSLLSLDFYPETPPSNHENEKKNQVNGIHSNTSIQPVRLTVKIIKTFSTTLSCALLVSVPSKQLESAPIAVNSALGNLVIRKPHSRPAKPASDVLVVLKLCDRRFSRGVREDYCAKPWTPEIEKELEAFEALDEEERPEASIEEGNDSWHYEGNDKPDKPDEYREEVDTTRKSRSSARRRNRSMTLNGKRERIRIVPDNWSDGHREAYMQKKCDRHCNTEVSIYRHLQPLQGKQIPMLYGTVQVTSDGASEKDRGGGRRVQGMLLEYIHPAFPLRETLAHISDPKKWQEVGETAVRIVQVVGDCGVLNQDVRLDNVLIIPVEGGYQEEANEQDDDDDDELFDNKNGGLKFFRAVMIDFGLARLRKEDETDEAWRKARLQQDEEGAIGYVFQKHLWKAVTAISKAEPEEKPFKYRPSGRLLRSWDNDEEDM